MAISVGTGIFTGLNTNQIIKDLISIERQPIKALQQEKSTFEAQISSYGSIKSSLTKLRDSLDNLKSDNIISMSASSSDDTVLGATASDDASEGTYSIQVNNLASAQKLYTQTFYSEDAKVADLSGVSTQKLKLQVGSNTPETITIDSSNNSLSGIRDAINDADMGITANIINSGFVVDGTNNTLVFNDGSNRTATLTAGTYTAEGLAAEIKRAMEDVNGSADTYSVSYDTSAKQFTITNDSGNSNSIDLLFEDGSTTAEGLLGFDSTDHSAVAAGSNITSDNAVGGYRLTLTSDTTGTNGRISILVDEDNDGTYAEAAETDTTALSRLAFDPTYDASGAVTGGTANLTQSVKGIDASFDVDGLTVSRSSNTGIDDVISGVTLDLLDTTSGSETVSLTVEKGTSDIIDNVNAFISAYNSAIGLVRGISVPQDGEGVLFTGDATTRSIQTTLRSSTTTSYAGNTLASFGLSHDLSAKLTLDEESLKNAIDSDMQSVIDSFDAMADTFETSLDNFINTAIPTRTEGLNDSIDSIDSRVENIQRRLVIKEETLREKFTALEQLVGELQNSSNFLSQQLASLPSIGSSSGGSRNSGQ